MEMWGTIIVAILTLMIFSYIFGDNFLFQLAAHIFVGVAVGYAMIVVWNQVFARLGPENLLTVAPALVMSILLIIRVRPTQRGLVRTLGSFALAFVVGVGWFSGSLNAA